MSYYYFTQDSMAGHEPAMTMNSFMRQTLIFHKRRCTRNFKKYPLALNSFRVFEKIRLPLINYLNSLERVQLYRI